MLPCHFIILLLYNYPTWTRFTIIPWPSSLICELWLSVCMDKLIFHLCGCVKVTWPQLSLDTNFLLQNTIALNLLFGGFSPPVFPLPMFRGISNSEAQTPFGQLSMKDDIFIFAEVIAPPENDSWVAKVFIFGSDVIKHWSTATAVWHLLSRPYCSSKKWTYSKLFIVLVWVRQFKPCSFWGRDEPKLMDCWLSVALLIVYSVVCTVVLQKANQSVKTFTKLNNTSKNLPGLLEKQSFEWCSVSCL